MHSSKLLWSALLFIFHKVHQYPYTRDDAFSHSSPRVAYYKWKVIDGVYLYPLLLLSIFESEKKNEAFNPYSGMIELLLIVDQNTKNSRWSKNCHKQELPKVTRYLNVVRILAEILEQK